MKRGFIGVIIAVVAVAAVLGWFYGLPAYRAMREGKLRQSLAENPKTADAYQLLVKGEERLTQDANDIEGYMDIGLAWKSIGDLTGRRDYLVRARDTYEKGVTLFGDQNVLIILNAASLARDLGDYERAEQLYRDAIRINPGGADAYVALVDLYRTQLKKDDAAIIDVYRAGLAAVAENAELVQSLAFYLKDVGRYADALSFFEMLEESYPGRFGAVIDELKEKMNVPSVQ